MKTNKSNHSRFALALVLAASTLVPSVALAESVGTAGYVTQLEVNESSADAYLQYHGRVVIEMTGKNASSGEYRWGGASCGSRVLSDASVSLLQRAMVGGLKVTPRYQAGQGSAQCLVGFSTSSN